MSRACVSIGSNLGQRDQNCEQAVERLANLDATRLIARSSLFETEPEGVTDQPAFINLAVVLETEKTAAELLKGMLAIEADLGRVRTIRWGPRTIDLDLLLFGDQIITSSELTVPHPRMHERRFVLAPLAELAPEAVHPILNKTVPGLLAELASDKRVARLEEG